MNRKNQDHFGGDYNKRLEQGHYGGNYNKRFKQGHYVRGPESTSAYYIR